jgi:hypothetical protein
MADVVPNPLAQVQLDDSQIGLIIAPVGREHVSGVPARRLRPVAGALPTARPIHNQKEFSSASPL